MPDRKRAAPEPARLRLERQPVHLAAPSDIQALLAALAKQVSLNGQSGDAVVVNIGSFGAEHLVLFCSANLGPAIANAQTVVVDVTDGTAYRAFARAVVESAIRSVGGLREAMRAVPVSLLGVQCVQVSQQLDTTALMVEGYALQRTHSELTLAAAALAAATRLFKESARVHEDNVRCMDDLRYEVMPALARIDRCLR